MPQVKTDTSRFPRTWVFDAMDTNTVQYGTVGIAQANTTILAGGIIPIACAVKVVKVAVSWLTATLANAPTFNIVYNTAQNLNAAQAYTQGNVAPMDNAYTGGITATTAGSTLVSATPTNLQGLGAGSPGFPNPALTTASPGFVQQGGLGIPTNVAVDGQPLFYNDVVLNTTNFPGANATNGGYGIIVPTNWDAVYPAGVYPYGLQQSLTGSAPAVFATPDFGACFTIRATSPTTTVTGLAVTLFWTPVLLAETTTSTASTIAPGAGQLF
jgi:hypothetical protein